MNLYAANREWANRPADERFESLEALLEKLVEVDAASRVRLFGSLGSVDFENGEGESGFVFKSWGGDLPPANFTHWSSEQFLRRLGIDKRLLGKIDVPVRKSLVENRLGRWVNEEGGESRTRALVAFGDRHVIRGFYGPRYERLKSSEVVSRTIEKLPSGFRNPVAYALGKFGEDLVPSGIYGGDRYEFLTLIDGGDFLDLGPRDRFHRGFIVWNSEVGERSFGWMDFFFDVCCGNNIFWNVSELQVTRAAHVSGVAETFELYKAFLDRLSGKVESPESFEAAVRAAKATRLAEPIPLDDENPTRWKGLVEKFRRLGFSATETRGANAAIFEEEGGGDGGTRWDWMEGFTAYARTLKNFDARFELDRRASSVLLATK